MTIIADTTLHTNGVRDSHGLRRCGYGIDFVKCCVFSEVDGRPKILTSKLDTLHKHEENCKVSF